MAKRDPLRLHAGTAHDKNLLERRGNVMENPDDIVAMEKAALVRWGQGDPDGFLEISAADVVYFDPYVPHRIDGLAALRAHYDRIRGQVLLARFDLIDPKVQMAGSMAVLTFNYVSWDGAGIEDRWNCTEVYRREAAGWRIAQTHWSRTTPTLAETA